jgi:stage III sporulation protein AE
VEFSQLEQYFYTLTPEQATLFGGNIVEYVKKIANGQFDFETNFGSFILRAIGVSAKGVLPMLSMIVAVAILTAIINNLKGNFCSQSVEKAVNFAGIAMMSIVVLVQTFNVIKRTDTLVCELGKQMEIVFPLLFTFMNALGASGSVTVYQPAVATLSFSVTGLVTGLAMPVLIATIVISIVGNLSSSIKLNGFAKFLESASKWVLYTAFFVFLGFLSLKGITAGVYDNMSVRTAKFALSKYVPVIGGYLSEGFNAILAGTVLVKNAVGLSSIVLMLSVVLPVLIEIIVLVLTLKLAGAITQSLGCEKITGTLTSISSSITLLISIVLGVCFSYFIFVVLIINSGNLVL